MPELPEVETVVRGLRPNLIDRKIVSFWTDTPKLIKNKSVEEFASEIKNKKIISVHRRAKNIIVDFDDGYSLLVHLKMTGHFLFGKWNIKNDKISLVSDGLAQEKVNGYIRAIFILNDKTMLGFSDLRKFGKMISGKTKDIKAEIEKFGTEATLIDFKELKKILNSTGRKIKQVLLDQSKVAGIGNIYADEVLWKSKIHPETPSNILSDKEIRELLKSIHEILALAIKLGGSSISDYRDVKGAAGSYALNTLVYKRENQPCKRCQTPIKKMKIAGRTARYCPKCQIRR